MLKVCRIICIAFIMFIITPVSACQASNYTKINDLIEKGKEFDNMKIVIKAEAIGEPLSRGKFTWVNVNDGTNSIGVWMSEKMSNSIKEYGNYKNKGDILEIKGTFTRNCKQHGGDLDIHAESVELKESGSERHTKINTSRLREAVVLIMITTILGFVYYTKNRI